MNLYDHIPHGPSSETKTLSRRATNDRDGRTSAKSALAHWDEDWTLIEDMTERRRIQNRIAQRNYRRRLKERLARLERHASRQTSSKEENSSSDKRDNTSSVQSNAKQKDVLPAQASALQAATITLPSKTSYQLPDISVEQQLYTSPYPVSSDTWILGTQSMSSYSDFSTIFEDSVFDYPDTQVWHRATWPHPEALLGEDTEPSFEWQ